MYKLVLFSAFFCPMTACTPLFEPNPVIVSTVKLFLKYYKQMKVDINVKDKYGYTPLHVACLCNCKNEILELMLSYEGILVDVENEDGNTPMHYFCKCFLSPTCQEISKRMLELGADLNKQNKVQCFAQFPSFLSHKTLRRLCCSVWGNSTPQGHIE